VHVSVTRHDARMTLCKSRSTTMHSIALKVDAWLPALRVSGVSYIAWSAEEMTVNMACSARKLHSTKSTTEPILSNCSHTGVFMKGNER